MKWPLIWIGIILLAWHSFPSNYTDVERALMLLPLVLALMFVFIFKVLGFSSRKGRETVSQEPGEFFQGSNDTDCGSGDGGGDCGGD